MITSKRYCSNCDSAKPTLQEILIPSPITTKCCSDGFTHKCQVCSFKKRMHLTLAEWKKLTESVKQQLCDHAFKLINSKEIDAIREGMLEMQGNLRFEPDLVKPAIPRLLDFLKEDFTTEKASESSDEVNLGKIGGIEIGIEIKIGSQKPATPGTLIRNAAIRTFGIVGQRKPELFSDAIPLIEKLIPNEESFSDEWYYDPPEFDWVVDHAINTLRILKVEEKILEKYEKIHQQLVRINQQLSSDGYSWDSREVWHDKRERRRVGRYVKDRYVDHGNEPVHDKSYVGVPEMSDT